MSYLFTAVTHKLTRANYSLNRIGSAAFWFKPTWSQNDNVDHYMGIQLVDGSNNWLIRKTGAPNDMRAGWTTSATSYQVVVATSGYTLVTNAWNSFVLTWDDDTNFTRLYLNGAQIGNNNALLTYQTPATLTWGTFLDTTNLSGSLAEASFHRTVLSPAQVTLHHQGMVATGYSQSVINYWPLVNNPNDLVGSADLTVTGATVSVDHPPMQPLFNPALRPQPRPSLVLGIDQPFRHSVRPMRGPRHK